MARPLHGLLVTQFSSLSNTTTLSIFIAAAIFTVASLVSILCTSHKHSKMKNKGRRMMPEDPLQGDHRKLLSNLSNIGGKALVMAKMISWKRGDVKEEEEAVWKRGDVEDEEAVWKKKILMGERCQPLEFSGKIMYDSEGNPLPELPSRSPELGNGDGNGSKGKH